MRFREGNLTCRLALLGCYPILFEISTWHWKRNGTQHGPQSNPRLLTTSLVKLAGVQSPSSGRRLWLYFRGGYALHADVYVDRRPLKHCAECGGLLPPSR